MYIIEAALEYFVAIAVGTTYLAKICTTIGMDDATIGILSAFVSLGQVFQLVTFLRVGHTPTRRRITLRACFASSPSISSEAPACRAAPGA